MKSGRKRLATLAAVLVFVMVAVSSGVRAGDDQSPAPARLVAYFIEWGIYDSGYFVKNVLTSGSAERLTHLNYAFANVAPKSVDDSNVVCQIADSWADYVRPATVADAVDGVPELYDESVLHGNFNQLRKLKRMFPRLRVFISLGGFTFSRYFSDAALTEKSRRTLVKSCVDMFIKGQLPAVSPGGPTVNAAGLFDGIDIDWEWPGNCLDGCMSRPEDKENFTLLLQEFRRQLDIVGRQHRKRYGLSIFAPAGVFNIDQMDLASVGRIVDFLTIQGYDLHGGWESSTNFHSALFSSDDDPAPTPQFTVDFTVDAYLARGVPARKIVVGVPFYGRGWSGVPATNNGLFQPAGGALPGLVNYHVLKALEASPGWNSFNDPSSNAHWIYNPTTREFWAFDDPAVMESKADYVTRRGLGGVMFWDLTGDDGQGTLVKTLDRGLRP